MNRQCSSRLTTSLSFDLTWLCLDLAGCSLTECKYRLKGTCIFNKDECWWSHDMTEQINLKQAPTEKEMFQCKTCEKTFQSRPETMKHRKQVHSETAPQCKSIVAGTECIFLKRGCWFNHKVETSQNADHLQSVWEKDYKV